LNIIINIVYYSIMAGLAIFDADGTLHKGFSIFPLYEAFADDGFITLQESTRLQEVFDTYDSGESDYHTYVVDTLRVAAEVLKGRRLSTADRISELFFKNPDFAWFGYVKPILSEITAAGVETILLTAEPQFIASGITAALAFDRRHSSTFGIENDGTFGGNVLSALGSQKKGELTQNLIAGKYRSFGFGDSEGDIGTLELVDKAICIQPTDGLRSHALLKNWTIVDNPEQPLTDLNF
jgi:phosphoserine phosphatase